MQVLHAHSASLQVLGALLAARSARLPFLCKAAIADCHSDLGEMERQGPSGRFLAQPGCMHSQRCRSAGGRQDFVASRSCAPLSLSRPTAINSDCDTPTLIDAFERLAQICPDAELALVRGGNLLTATRAKAESCLASARIHMPGFDDPGKWLSWSDCFVLPSRKEGLSNALLAAMAAGVPCIANDIPPNREVLAGGATGVLVSVGDEDALYDAMKVMATDADHAAGFAAASHDRVCR